VFADRYGVGGGVEASLYSTVFCGALAVRVG